MYKYNKKYGQSLTDLGKDMAKICHGNYIILHYRHAKNVLINTFERRNVTQRGRT